MVDPVPITDLADALDLGPHELVSFVGGGGKTTALLALGSQLEATVVLTTTTKMGRDRTGGYPVLFAPTHEELTEALAADGAVLAWKADAAHKALGVDPQTCDRWFDLADHVVVEADGSRRLPFKAPRPYEPVVPSRTTMLVACVGADALGRVIADRCQRPLRVAAVAGCSPYERLTPARLARVVLSERGSRKDCPDGSRFAVMVNRVGERELPFVDELVECVAGAAPVVTVAPFAVEGGP